MPVIASFNKNKQKLS